MSALKKQKIPNLLNTSIYLTRPRIKDREIKLVEIKNVLNVLFWILIIFLFLLLSFDTHFLPRFGFILNNPRNKLEDLTHIK
jgi:hypothetical protein